MAKSVVSEKLLSDRVDRLQDIVSDLKNGSTSEDLSEDPKYMQGWNAGFDAAEEECDRRIENLKEDSESYRRNAVKFEALRDYIETLDML